MKLTYLPSPLELLTGCQLYKVLFQEHAELYSHVHPKSELEHMWGKAMQLLGAM